MIIISVKDACKILNLSPARVRQLINSGRLPASKIGRTYVLTREEVEAFANVPRPDGRPPKATE